MSNKQQLQTNNTKYASLIETLRGKSVGGGEDVTAETNEYTEKITQLENAVTALESELADKASGGSGGGSVDTCTIKVFDYYNQSNIAVYTAYVNGSFTAVLEGNQLYSFDGVLENVVCGSAVFFPGDYLGATCTDGVVSHHGPLGAYYIAPLTANSVATITLIQD